MEFYEDILFHIIVVAQNCIEKYLLCETSCTSFFLSYHLLLFFFLLKQYTFIYIYMYEIYFERSIRPSIYQRFKGKHFQDILRFAILNMYAYSALILKLFQSEIQETFKFNFDDIYF